MDEKRPSYEELVARLEDAETTLDALRRGEIDSLMGEAGPLLVQYKAAVDELARLRAEAEQLAQQWQATFDATSDAIWILDAEQRIVRANKAAEATFGCSMAEMIGKRCCEIAHGTAAPIPECPFPPMRQSRQRESIEMQLGERWFAITTDPLLDTEGNLTGAVHIARDITARKQAEEQVRQSEERYRLLAETTRDIILLHDMQGRIMYVNRAGLDFTGFELSQVIGQPLAAFIPPEEIVAIQERFRQRAAGDLSVFRYESEFINRAGQHIPVEVNSTPILRNGQIEAILIVARDISERKRAEEQIRFQASLVENTSDAIIATDLEYNILSWNMAAETIYGWKADEVLGQPLGKFLQTQFIDDTLEQAARTVREKGFWRGEVLQSRKDGTTVPILASVTLFRDRKGNPQGLVAVNRDITERKEAERRIRESEETYRNLFHNAQVGLFRTRIADGKILESNEQLAHMFGYDSREEFIAEYATAQNYVDSGTRERMLRELQEHGEVRNFQARFYRKDRSIFWAQYSAKIYPEQGWIEGIAEDITARKKTEQALERQRFELQTLYEASQELRRTLDPEQIYAAVYRYVHQSMPCDSLIISAFDPQTKQITCRAAWNDDIRLDVSRLPPIPLEPEGQGTQSAVIRTGKPLLLNDYERHLAGTRTRYYIDEQGQTQEQIPAGAPHPRSALIVPLEVEGQVTGVLQVFSNELNAFTPEHLRLLESLSTHIASALQNAALYQAAQREIAERKQIEAQLRAAHTELQRLLDETERSRRALLNIVEDLRKAEEDLETERTLLRTLIDHLPVAVYVKDTAGRKTLANPVDVHNTGFASEADVLGKTDAELFPPDLAAAYEADDRYVLETGQPIIGREEPITRPGSQFGWQLTSKVPLRDNAGQIIGLVGIGLDITERKQAEELLRLYTEQLETMVEARTRALQEAQERLLRQERLATLGQIAGGIAHELRTPLGAIKNAAYLINMLLTPQAADADADPALREALDILSREVSISDRIITSLLNFARPQQPARHLVQVGEVLQEVLAHTEVPPQITVCREIAPQLPPILADAGQLEQIFGNLILNAIQAMPDGGQLTVRVEHCTSLPEIAPPGFTTKPLNGPPAGWIAVTIADTGIGIPPENMTRIFEPLFTTKAKGMGLGLALVKLLTQANGGSLAVSTTPGRGSTFQTFWPIA